MRVIAAGRARGVLLAGGAGAVAFALVSAAVVSTVRPNVHPVSATQLQASNVAGFDLPQTLTVFTKFVSSFAGPTGEIVLAGSTVDWEVELVAVIGRRARQVVPQDAWDHIAGLTVGQDLSERTVQMAGPAPQFSLGKSFPGFSPTGPWLVTADEFEDRDDLALGCSVNGEAVQKGRTSDLVFPVPALIAELSAVVPLEPGDVIFTGTPAGVGMGSSPQRFLQPGEVLTSSIEGVGELRQTFVRR